MQAAEIWKPIPTTRNEYEASSLGSIRKGDRLVRLSKHPRGYVSVSVRMDQQKPTTRLAHRLVADAFIGPCPTGLQVNHKDGDRKNNRPDNLEYVTQTENNLHAVARIGAYRGNQRKDSTMTAEVARQIVTEHRAGMGYKRIAKKFGITWGQARAVATQQSWKWATSDL